MFSSHNNLLLLHFYEQKSKNTHIQPVNIINLIYLIIIITMDEKKEANPDPFNSKTDTHLNYFIVLRGKKRDIFNAPI